MTKNYDFPMFDRLVPKTPFRGGRIADTDLLNLSEAARFASVHAGTEITPADFLRAAGRGEITLRAIVHQTAKLQKIGGGVYCNAGQPNENTAPKGSILNLPLTVCKQLATTGLASWREFDGFERIEGILMRYTVAELDSDQSDFETVTADCMVTGDAVNALADAYIDEPAPAQTPAPVVAASDDAAPLPLSTGDIAHCFNGLHWDECKWKANLANKPKWLRPSIAIPGLQGVSETRWNPVSIGAALASEKSIAPRSIRAKFQTNGLLSEWLEAWKDYEAQYLTTD